MELSTKNPSTKKKFLFIAVAIVIVAAIIFGIMYTKKDEVASVEGEAITKDDLYDVLVKQYGSDAVSSLIDTKIVDIEADKKNITISDKEIDKEYQTYEDQYGGEDALKTALEQSGITEADLKSEITTYLKIVELLESKVEITEKEMKAYFEENKDSYAEEAQVQGSHILVADEATANEVKAKLDAGEDFAELAKEYSTDTGTAESGGDLGFFTASDMVEEFSNVAFSLEVGAISDPVKTDYGYHIIKVTDKKAATEAVYEDHKAEIKQTLFDEEIQTKYSTWIANKREKLDITNTLSTDSES